MTIDAGFLKILKKEVAPHAFVSTLPVRPDMVFLDGQVLLMKANAITTWPVFLKVQFESKVRRSFETGADVVVLAFDDYTYVPRSKTMTQSKRNKVQPAMEFSEEDELPAYMPAEWMSAMRNRTFKVKVIRKVIIEMKEWFAELAASDPYWAQRSLVIDFHDMPEVVGRALPDARVPEYCKTEEFAGRGECDVKAYSWMPVSRCLLIDSIDGDYVPLTLLQQELQRYSVTMPDCMQTDNQATENVCNTWLRRMVTNVGGAKRKASDVSDASGTIRRREYEYVNINTIYEQLERVMPSTVQSPIRQFCSLVAMCGCDFAMSLPRMGPSTLWNERHHVRKLNLSDPTEMLRGLGVMYNHALVSRGTMPPQAADSNNNLYALILGRIKGNSKISPKVKEALWTPERAAAHTLNVAWTMLYWTQLQTCPDPHSQDFGYAKDKKGRTQFAHA